MVPLLDSHIRMVVRPRRLDAPYMITFGRVRQVCADAPLGYLLDPETGLTLFPGSAKVKPMPEQYIFTIENLTKAYAKREVLKNIWLAFYPGAKIGVIGSNGAGKSTLLRVMALAEKDFIGSARPADGIRIGFVPQEPRLDETTDVKGNLEEAVAPTRALLKRHEDISAKLSESLSPDA